MQVSECYASLKKCNEELILLLVTPFNIEDQQYIVENYYKWNASLALPVTLQVVIPVYHFWCIGEKYQVLY